MRVPDLDGAGMRLAALPIAKALQKYSTPIIGMGVPLATGHWTLHNTGTGAGIVHETGPSSGLLLTTPSDDYFNISMQSRATWTFTGAALDNRWCAMVFRVKVDDISNIGFALGIGNTQVQNFTTDFTNKVVFQKAIAAGAVIGSVRSASGTARDSATLGTMVNDTEVELFVVFKKGATASACRGSFFYNGTETKFSSAQLTALAALTGAVQFTVNCTGVMGATKNMTVAVGYGELDINEDAR